MTTAVCMPLRNCVISTYNFSLLFNFCVWDKNINSVQWPFEYAVFCEGKFMVGKIQWFGIAAYGLHKP